jgi:small subunit ribosomal protein S6
MVFPFCRELCGIPAIFSIGRRNPLNSYELTVIIRNSNLDPAREKMMETLTKHGVTVVNEEPWGVKRMAYEINGEKDGYYYFANVEADPSSVEKVLDEFRLQADLLRYLFVKTKSGKKSA